MKKIIICICILCIALCNTALAVQYSDIPEYSPYYEAVSYLSEQGILTGYGDGTFLPDNTITRAEAATIITRAAGLGDMLIYEAKFTDVDYEHWAFANIIRVSDAGIIDGMGDGTFRPDDDVTYYQIIKMIVCMMGREAEAIENGGYPYGYADTAFYSGIIDASTHYQLEYGYKGLASATRGDVAKYIYNAMSGGYVQELLMVGGTEYRIGMNASDIGQPDEILPSADGLMWYVYGTDNYENFIAAGVKNNIVTALASAGPGFEYKGMKAGEYSAGRQEYIDNRGSVLIDKNDDDKIHAVFISGSNVNNYNITEESLMSESRMIFHFNNAFRVQHGKEPFVWSDKAAASATLHSQDMAMNDYFSHISQDGTQPNQRMEAQGIDWSSCAENISAGHVLGINAYNAWVNSSGHRGNMLGDFVNLGVGGGYNGQTAFNCYFTQNFYTDLWR